MKLRVKHTFGVLILLLLSINVYLVTNSMALEDEIKVIEKNMAELRVSNLELRNELSTLSSLEYLDAVASSMDFDDKSEAIHFEELKHAQIR